MLTEKESLYGRIQNHLVDGELPADFSLIPRKDKNQITFADGARDGIAIYHMGQADVTEESMGLLAELMCDVSDGRREAGRQKLLEFAKKNTPLNAIDDFEQYIIDHANELNAKRLHEFAVECMESLDVDLVKFGMEILEVFSEPGETEKEMIRTLGLCDEFTLFSIFNMLCWEDANNEIFALAQKVHGWGRIHAVERLEPENDVIRDWLLKEGIHNRVVPDYSALEVYEKAKIREMLSAELTGEQLDCIAAVIRSLMSEGPVQGISAIGDADGMLLEFIGQAVRHGSALSMHVCDAVHGIAGAKCPEEVTRAAWEFLRRKEVDNAVRGWVQEGEMIELAQALGIDYYEPLYQCMERDFGRHFYQCAALMADDTYREKVLGLFRKKLPMQEMVAELEDNRGLGEEYADYSKLVYLVQNLEDYPMCGGDFVELALQSPVVSNRNMALRVLDHWCKKKECTLDSLSGRLAERVRVLKTKECSESVLENMEKYGF